MITPLRTRWQLPGLMLCLAFITIGSGGCSRLRTEYGTSKGASGTKSLNGFGALRTAYKNAGYRTRDVSRLSDRVKRTNVIVWTPQVLTPIDQRVTGWFERWFRRGKRTLVYIIPDSGSELDYWIDAGPLAPPPQRLEYRMRAAQSTNERMMWRLNRGGVSSNGWFQIEPQETRAPVGELEGPWADRVAGDTEIPKLFTELRLLPYDPDNAASSPAAGGPGVFNGPTGPASPGWNFPIETSPTRTSVEFRTLLVSESGETLVAEVTSETWRDSKIIVVAGGSLLTNYALSRRLNRRLADEIIRKSWQPNDPEPIAGFMTSGWATIPVSERKQGVPTASGMELLTVWPLSIVTTHGMMLGLVICLMLLPIFGRPKHVRQSDQSEFGHHLDAVAALMKRAGGEEYARSRVKDYESKQESSR